MDPRLALFLVLWAAALKAQNHSDSPVPLKIFPRRLSAPSDVQRHVLVEYVKAKGYVLEEHEVVTEDKYILVYHRLVTVENQNVTAFSIRFPVLLVHGLALSSAAFLTTAPWGLAYKLLKNYDVWLVNTRGNRYSRKHDVLNPDTDDKYWDFSLHEAAVFDLTAGINYIIRHTNFPKLGVVGHSSGAAESIIMAAFSSNIQSRIYRIIALAPLFKLKEHLVSVVDKQAIIEDWKLNKTAYGVFLDGKHWKHMCVTNVGNLCKITAQDLSRDRKDWPDIVKFLPSGTSVKLFQQVWGTGPIIKGVEYNKDLLKNLTKDVSSFQTYDLSGVTVPLDIFYSDSDGFVPIETNTMLTEKIKNTTLHEVKEKINHLDFIWGHPDNNNLNLEVIKVLDAIETL